MEINNEIKSIAACALRDAFSTDLDNLMAVYLAAAEGLSMDAGMLYEVLASGLAVEKLDRECFNLHASWPAPGIFGPDHQGSCSYDTVLEALQDERAEQVWLQGVKVFEKIDGEWWSV